MDDPTAATDSSGVPSTIERSSLDFTHEAGTSNQGTVAPEMPPSEDVPATDAPGGGQAEEVAAIDPSAATESRKRGLDETDVNAPPKVLRRDHTDPRPTVSAHGGKSLAAIQLGLASTHHVPVPENAPAGVSDSDPLSFADSQSRHPADIAHSSQGTAAAGDPDSENASFPFAVGSPESGNGVTAAPEVRTRGKAAEEVRCSSGLPDKRIQAREMEIKNLEVLLEAEADMKKAAKDRSAGLSQELEDMRSRFSDLQVSNDRLSQQVATLQEQVSGDEKLKAAFEEFKRIDFDEELYPHMLTAIAGRRWVIGRGLRLAVMKCGESLELRQAFADVISAGICKGALKDLKYPLVDQLEGLKDAPMDVIMAALYLESDTGDDAPHYIRDLRPSSSQLTIPVYPEVRDPRNPWAYKEEMLLADAIAANISRAEKKKKCRIVCRTHGVGSAHYARPDGVPVSVPTVVPQGLALLLADAATQADLEEAT
nr:hypothetical protein [Tanacetum cinerariifolium]